MYGEEHKSKGLDLEEIEYEDIAEEIDDEDLEEIEYVDFEDETEYAESMHSLHCFQAELHNLPIVHHF